MKTWIYTLPVWCLLASFVIQPVAAQEGDTVINSDAFRLDLSKKEGVFTGNVSVKDKNFELSSEELTVFFSEDNKVKRLLARGKVKIKHGSRRNASSREAEYFVDDKKLRLIGDPVVAQDGNWISGKIITIYPESDRMDVEGRTKVQFEID